MSLIFSFLMMMSPLWAAPEACSTIDLTNTPGVEMSLIPRWDQGNTHLCYAYSVSTLVDYYRMTRGDRDVSHLSSPLLLSLKTIAGYGRFGSGFSGGRVEHSFAAAKNYGTCGIQQISDRLGPVFGEALLKKILRSYREVKSHTDRKLAVADSLRRFLQFAKVKPEELPEVNDIEKAFSLSEIEFVSSLLLRYCGDNKKLDYLPSPKLLFQPDASGEDILQQTQQLLSSRIPVGINFCANVVTDSSHQGKWTDGKWFCQNNKNHSAIVVGRKMIQGRCHVLVRDTGCAGYKDQPGRCKDGQYWLDSDQLTQNLHGIFWLE